VKPVFSYEISLKCKIFHYTTCVYQVTTSEGAWIDFCSSWKCCDLSNVPSKRFWVNKRPAYFISTKNKHWFWQYVFRRSLGKMLLFQLNSQTQVALRVPWGFKFMSLTLICFLQELGQLALDGNWIFDSNGLLEDKTSTAPSSFQKKTLFRNWILKNI